MGFKGHFLSSFLYGISRESVGPGRGRAWACWKNIYVLRSPYLGRTDHGTNVSTDQFIFKQILLAPDAIAINLPLMGYLVISVQQIQFIMGEAIKRFTPHVPHEP